MDLICTKCGEPWDLDYVLQEAPEDFIREGSAILHCPACPENEKDIYIEAKNIAAKARAIADVMGDDLDGAASEMDDLWK